jgi:RNA polymerase sigma factor (sigma-70 family)
MSKRASWRVLRGPHDDENVMIAYQGALAVAQEYLPRSPENDRDDIVSDALLGATDAWLRWDPRHGTLKHLVWLASRQRVGNGFVARSGVHGRPDARIAKLKAGHRAQDEAPWARPPMYDPDDRLSLVARRFDLANHVAVRVDVWKCVDSLTRWRKIILVMTMLGFSQSEIGRHLGVSQMTVSNMFQEICDELRQKLAVAG